MNNELRIIVKVQLGEDHGEMTLRDALVNQVIAQKIYIKYTKHPSISCPRNKKVTFLYSTNLMV